MRRRDRQWLRWRGASWNSFFTFSQVFVGLPPGGRWLRPGDFRPVGVAQPGDEGSTCDDNQVVLGRGQRGGGGSVGAEGCLYATRALIYRQTPETEEFFLVWFSLFYYISEKKSRKMFSKSEILKMFHWENNFLLVDISLHTIWGSRFIWPELWVLPSVVCGVKKVGDWLGLSIVSTPPTVTTVNIKKKYEFRS